MSTSIVSDSPASTLIASSSAAAGSDVSTVENSAPVSSVDSTQTQLVAMPLPSLIEASSSTITKAEPSEAPKEKTEPTTTQPSKTVTASQTEQTPLSPKTPKTKAQQKADQLSEKIQQEKEKAKRPPKLPVIKDPTRTNQNRVEAILAPKAPNTVRMVDNVTLSDEATQKIKAARQTFSTSLAPVEKRKVDIVPSAEHQAKVKKVAALHEDLKNPKVEKMVDPDKLKEEIQAARKNKN